MRHVTDFHWQPGMTVSNLVTQSAGIGFHGSNVAAASAVISRMHQEGARVFLTFTSNMVTSGLRGFFAQVVALGIPHALVTTVGAIEEDIMKATGEQFSIGSFFADDVDLHERGINRVGNLFISNESYQHFESKLTGYLEELYAQKKRWAVSEMLAAIGSKLDDAHSILYQAAQQNVPIFCPAITDGAFGFHLYMFQRTHPDFIVDVVSDFRNILLCVSQDDKKGIISLGGSISKHHAILACLLNGGVDYAVYMTTARSTSGSMSGATTNEAKSWGKVKDDADAVTVIGDVSVTFPLAMVGALEDLSTGGFIRG